MVVHFHRCYSVRHFPVLCFPVLRFQRHLCLYVQGLFSRMTFRRELFLGGFKNISEPAPKTAATSGFRGCVKRLQINNKYYDMRKGSFIGDTLYGINVGQFQQT